MADTLDLTNDAKNDDPVPGSVAAAPLTPQPENKRRKVARTSLTLREKAIVKSFCEQKLTDCKVRGQSQPSQEALRQEVVSQFGWSCGRSTLSKIIAMDWKLLRGSHEGGEAPRNFNMKRRRRPLFPAFEADLVKFILKHVDKEIGSEKSYENAMDVVSVDTEDATFVKGRSGEYRRRPLTEALILEEAQRLKEVHGVTDKMLVLSVGWLARFKHRHCIRLRKPARKDTVNSVESDITGIWTDGLPSATPATIEPLASRHGSSMGDNEELWPLSTVPPNTIESTKRSVIPTKLALCSAPWIQKDYVKVSSKMMALLDRVPKSIRDLGCSCHDYEDLIGAINGLNVVVVGLGSVVDAFLLAQEVGVNGSVTCLEASSSNIGVAEQIVGSFCHRTLGLTTVNMNFIVADYSNQSFLQTDEFKNLKGKVDFALCSCSFQSSEFSAGKDDILKMTYSLLKVGGELRVSNLVCSRRLSLFETEEICLAEKRYNLKKNTENLPGSSTHLQFKLLLGAPYLGDLQRMFRTLDGDVEVRIRSCSEADAAAINSAIDNLLPYIAPTGVQFRRIIVHAFRLDNVEDTWEDYGQSAIFNGCIAEDKAAEDNAGLKSFHLDDTYNFQKGVHTRIDGNTAQILQATWMQRYFSVSGDRSRHCGPFAKKTHTCVPASGSTCLMEPRNVITIADLTTSSPSTRSREIANM